MISRCLKSPFKVLLWIFSLSFLSVGARNFEEGLSVDGPLYGALSRNLLRSSDIFVMKSGLSDFPVYSDHPHFGFWLHALWLKFFPAQDWALRIPSHLMYVAFLFLFWRVLSYFHSPRVATLGVLLLWIWAPFSNYFSNFYLDPGALLLGSLFLVYLWKALRENAYYSLASGVFLALCAGYKGLSVLAFGPAAAMLCMMEFRLGKSGAQNWKTILKILAVFVGALAILGPYYWGIKNSGVPNFLELYWNKQMTHRFSGSFGLLQIFNWNFWRVFFRDTLGLGLLMMLGIWKLRSYRESFLLPLFLFLTVVMMYAPTDRSGGQYTLMLFPWVAWLTAQYIDFLLSKWRLCPLTSRHLMKASGTVAVAGVLFIQYLPFKTHARSAPPEVAVIKSLPQSSEIKKLYLDLGNESADFASSSPLAWYLDKSVEYVQPQMSIPFSEADSAYILRKESPEKLSSLKAAQWCHLRETVWLKCSL